MELTYDKALVQDWEVEWIVRHTETNRSLLGPSAERIRRIIGHMERIRSTDWWAENGREKVKSDLSTPALTHMRKQRRERLRREAERQGLKTLGTIAKEQGLSCMQLAERLVSEHPGRTNSELAKIVQTSTPKKINDSLCALLKLRRVKDGEKRKCRETGAYAREWFPVSRRGV